MVRAKEMISTAYKSKERKEERYKPRRVEPMKRRYKKKETVGEREERGYFFKKQVNKYETEMLGDMKAIKGLIKKFDYERFDNNKVLNSLMNFAQDIIDETKKIENVGRMHYIINNGGIKLYWVHPFYKSELMRHLESIYEMSEFWQMNVEEGNENERYYGYRGQKCVIIPRYKEHIHLETMITNVPIRVNDGYRERLFTPHCIVVVNTVPPEKELNERLYEFMKPYIRSEWYPEEDESTEESIDLEKDIVNKEDKEVVSTPIPTQVPERISTQVIEERGTEDELGKSDKSEESNKIEKKKSIDTKRIYFSQDE